MVKWFIVLFVCSFFCLAYQSPPAVAASLDVLDKQRNLPPEPKAQPRARVQEEAGQPVYDKSLQFPLGSLTVENASVFTQEELLAPYRALYGKQVSFDQIKHIAAELTKKYRDAGYLLSQVVLPAQELDASNAHIRLVAVEGNLSSVQYVGEAALVQRFSNYFAGTKERLLQQKPFRHTQLERAMLLLQDLPGITASSSFQKGSAPNTSVLVLEVKQKPVSGNVSWNNGGTESAGPGQWNANLNIATFPRIGWQTTLSYAQADVFDEYYSWQVGQSYQFANGFMVRASYGESSSNAPDSIFARLFDYKNSSRTMEAGLSYPIIRSRDMNLSAGTTYTHRNGRASLLDERYTTDRLRSLAWNVNFDVADGWDGVTQFITTLTHGMDVFNATDHEFESSSPLSGAKFVKGNFYLSRNQQLPYRFSLLTTAELQLADSPLASYNQFSLGGNQFGRGYEPGALSNDNAFATNLEPRWTYPLTEKIALQLFGFYDWGSVWGGPQGGRGGL